MCGKTLFIGPSRGWKFKTANFQPLELFRRAPALYGARSFQVASESDAQE